MTKEIKETKRHYLLLSSVSQFGISFISAFYVTFLITKGLNLLEVNMVNFVFFTTLFICEIPTGAFADVFGRKVSYVVSCSLFSLGMFVYGLVDSFWGFALAESIAAVGATFASGAFRAWLIDRLRHQGFTGSLGKVFAQEQIVIGVVGITGPILGAFLADKNQSLPWFAGGAFMAVGAVLAAVFMREEDEFAYQKFSFKEGLKSMKETIRVSARYGASNRAVKFILITSFAQLFAVQAPNMQWQPFFGQFLPNKTSFGFLFASMSIAIMAGSAVAPWFLRQVEGEKKAISLTQLVIGSGICLTVMFDRIAPALGIFLAHEFARGLFLPLKDVYLNDNIPSKERATLISFDAISRHIGGMIGLVVSGVLAQYMSLPTAWMISGLVLVVTTLV